MNGILNIYKEAGFTSFDVIAKLRGILHTRKIGHTGTLDPMAEGVLPVCVGNATKLCEMLMDHDKVYEARMVLGVTYDTQDITGNKLTEVLVMSTNNKCQENNNAFYVDETSLRNVIASFVGGYEQTPPMYSAKKIDGQKLYDLARAGKEVERKSVHVDIYDIEIIGIDLPYVDIRVHCGKGTYIRTLIDDIGKKLSCGASMYSLLRTKVGDLDISDSHRLSEVEEMMKNNSIEDVFTSVDSVFEDCRSIVVPERLCKLLYNGNPLNKQDFDLIDSEFYVNSYGGEKIRVYDYNGQFIAVYEYIESRNLYKPYRMFM